MAKTRPWKGWSQVALVAAVLASLLAVSAGEPATQGRVLDLGKQAFLAAFNLHGNGSFWMGDNLVRTLDELRAPLPQYTHRDVDAYVKSGNLATYLGLKEVESIAIPIPVNLVFVGFDGMGNFGLRLGELELQEWFEHIDHILQHTRIPRSGHGPKGVKPDTQHGAEELPILSYASYNFSIHAINTGPKVASLFDKALYVFSRKVDPLSTTEDWRQVDVDFVASLMGSLVKHLHLDNAHNLFLLNLKREPNAPRYGYRLGYSTEELALLEQHGDTANKLLVQAAAKPAEDTFSRVTNLGRLKTSRPKTKFHWRLVDDEADSWVKAYTEALFSEEEALASKHVHGATDIDKMFAHTAYALRKGSAEHRALLQTALSSKGKGIHEECLVDAWVGKDRFAFIDLSAGPFAWGPIAGGEGIRTEASVPSVERIFSNATEKDLMPDKSDDELEQELETLAELQFGAFNATPGHAVDMLLAEVDIYEAFAEKHCQNRRRKIELCEELEARMSEMHNELWKHHAEVQDPDKKVQLANAAAKIRHKHRIFNPKTHEPYIAQKVNPNIRARDIFLSQLGALVSNTLRHVIAPPAQEGHYKYYPKVSFHLYIISQGTTAATVDVEAFKKELMELRLPTQQFQFATHKLSLADDPALATAFSEALHSSAVPALRTDGTYVAMTRRYLDSAELQHSLRAQLDHTRGRSTHHSESLEVPVFLFVVSGPPVFLDQHHTARALPDMVLAVQAEEIAWESQLQCNGKPIFWDLRHPLKGLVGATVQHLAGILPSHVAYSPAHGEVLKDWLWSVGPNPLSATSAGWRLSAMHVDAVHRSYLVNTIDSVVEKLNAGTALLADEKAHADAFHALRKLPVKELVASYNSILEFWAHVLVVMEELDYTTAVHAIARLEADSQRFLELAESVHAVVHPVKCMRRRQLDLGLGPVAAGASVALLLGIYFVVKPSRSKPKIN